MTTIPPTFNSFVTPSVYSTQNTTNDLYVGFVAGNTYVVPTFGNAGACATTVDPGGLFGWLIYSRTSIANPAKGLTSDQYLLYSTPTDFLNDLNALKGVTQCVLSLANSGGTYSFFTRNAATSSNVGSTITPTTIGADFLHALHALAYGVNLVITGTTGGLENFDLINSSNIEVLMGQTANASLSSYLLDNPYVVGIFPSNGYTAANFDLFIPSGVTNADFTDRIFNIYGNVNYNISTSTLYANSTMNYTTTPVAHVVGAFANSKNQNQYYLTVAGDNLSVPLNGKISNPISWYTTTKKDIFKKNRVNFYTYVSTPFLGSDLVGATAGTSTSYTSDERIGVANLKNTIEKSVNDILLTYLFNVNNSITRASITTQVELYIESINEYLVPSATIITCDGTNNTDNSSTLTVDITVKPIQSASELVIRVSVSDVA